MGPGWPTRSFESLVTAVYQYEVRAGWTLQPNFQYIVHPGGGATDPLGPNPGKPLKDAGKEQRWQNYWDSFVSLLESVPLDHQICEKAGELLADARRAGKTVPLGDGLHAAVAELEDLTVATVDVDHFKALGVRAVNPLK